MCDVNPGVNTIDGFNSAHPVRSLPRDPKRHCVILISLYVSIFGASVAMVLAWCVVHAPRSCVLVFRVVCNAAVQPLIFSIDLQTLNPMIINPKP